MANLKEVRTRIESVNSTKQITSAMKMVAASKLRKAQNSIMALRPYADKFSEILERIMADSQQPMANSQQPTANNILIIPLSSNKGLCGTFNANVIRETMNLIKNEYQELFDNGKVDILCVGSKVEEALRFKKYPVVGNENILLDDITYDNAAAFAELPRPHPKRTAPKLSGERPSFFPCLEVSLGCSLCLTLHILCSRLAWLQEVL